MVCVQCGQKTEVINSRPQRRSNQVWRRRQCQSCGNTFTTLESADYSAVWAISAPKGRIHPFSRDKLFLSLHRSCQHRKTAVSDAAALTETVIQKLASVAQDGHLTPQQIMQTAQVALNRFDKAASVHYAAFHQM